ncbi:MAG TPA: penicillin-binding protein A [Clostridiales bacterium]|nr:penicillin-binding protein A [Clostridiales bacterium]
MKHLKRNIGRAFLILLGLFVLLTVYFSYNLSLYSERWFSNPNNTRLKVDTANPEIIPGSIMDRNRNVLVETKTSTAQDGTVTYYRDYHKDSKYAAHVVGSKQYGIGGEALFIRYLLGYDNNLFERIYQKAFLDQELGNNVILTIDIELQKYISDSMGNAKGSVVVMNPQNGEILALVSQPSFNPSDTNEEPEEESLINRASYGKYPPGSIIKIVTAAAALETMDEIGDYTVRCTGKIDIDGIIVSCYGDEAHGEVNLSKAMELSCNAYFAQLAQNIGWKQLKKTAEAFGFNKDFLFSDIKTSKSQFPISRLTDVEELVWSAVGQAKVSVTPLHMVMLASAIANGGNMTEPRLIYGIELRTGRVKLQNKSTLTSPISAETSKTLTNIMIGVVENGTGYRAKSTGMLTAGKTGTAEVAADQKPHAWFIGFAPADEPSLAIAVILENAGTGGRYAAPLAGKVLRNAKKLGY